MINRVVLVGRLVKDPELRYTPSGVAVATFTLAVNRTFTNGEGEREADFINIVAWRQLAELCANYLKKGSQAGLEGRLQTRSYDNKEGKRVYVTEVVADNVQFLSPTGERRENSSASSNDRGYDFGYNNPPQNDRRAIDIQDDDLPF
ncbi:single-stranded DNA-binding protein [Ammoniphilus resinae]|uniref:Single-stranded DNA-binding protein n=1 Tax=Ammoniphilus resinae TaxID=861532 RepID=A0ABS4GNF6_9BACL|nr:single-stranded DNA-binding protein [Ammoniphilus resinae]MBP1931779.1 single-strand DNA-binding protein [Ammoniphilus resinae]